VTQRAPLALRSGGRGGNAVRKPRVRAVALAAAKKTYQAPRILTILFRG
jgi:hypothetical protein